MSYMEPDSEYRQDDESRGHCPVCSRPLSSLTVAAMGFCEEHGWQAAEWSPRTSGGINPHEEGDDLHGMG